MRAVSFATDAATKAYVDGKISGGSLSTLLGTFTESKSLNLTKSQYADDKPLLVTGTYYYNYQFNMYFCIFIPSYTTGGTSGYNFSPGPSPSVVSITAYSDGTINFAALASITGRVFQL